ncbi:hypothetical protein DFP72DRAFT_228641 [Ephemerocybe angulata]|uniref:Uncharacterized protein n=1 Tax=Ephemerocybe angulata TaxID=980116 RepID=A0A8H6LUP4_9AGAR|nr:hypothetical protein DFP72DRAFT_228641 [Tulosesus angulatus]
MLNMIPLAVQRCDLSQWLDVKIPPKKSKSVKKSVTDFFTVTSRKRKAANPPVATGKKRSKAKSTELTQPSTVVFNDAYVVPPIPPPKDDSSSSDSEASDSGEETDRTATPTITSTDTKRGRPLLTVLDKLSILWNNQPGDNPRRYKCIGKGCNVTWKPRAKDRVLKHAKNCRALTQQQRQTAASHSALSAPSVAAAANPLPATPSPPTKASASSTFYPGSSSFNISFLARNGTSALRSMEGASSLARLCSRSMPQRRREG